MHKKVSNAKLCHFHLPQLVTVTDFYHSVSSMWCHFNFMYQGLHQKPLENEILQFWSRHSNLFLGIGCEKCLINFTRSTVSVSCSLSLSIWFFFKEEKERKKERKGKRKEKKGLMPFLQTTDKKNLTKKDTKMKMLVFMYTSFILWKPSTTPNQENKMYHC